MNGRQGRWGGLKLYLAFVAGDVEASVERHYADGLLLLGLRHYRKLADTASRREFPEGVEMTHYNSSSSWHLADSKTYLWKSVMQWIWLTASTVKGIPSKLLPQTTHVKHWGWYGFPVALRIRSRIGFMHTEHFSRVFCKILKMIVEARREKYPAVRVNRLTQNGKFSTNTERPVPKPESRGLSLQGQIISNYKSILSHKLTK